MTQPVFEYAKFKENSISGRVVTEARIADFLKKSAADFELQCVGHSVENRKIEALTLGRGPVRIFMWSQMHGNETTTTKALLDLINFFRSNSPLGEAILRNCSLRIIPLLNPDGAERYTRANANAIDLNRDAQERTQPESRVLYQAYSYFNPQYCFNLHDQRTIYNVGETAEPATLSFLAPAHDAARNISVSRLRSMQLIAAINAALQPRLPGRIGRYDDAFNPNCVGDAFQLLGTPTLLFEAGHFPRDYQRERTREYLCFALLAAIDRIFKDDFTGYDSEAYFDIPPNGKRFFDILIRNASRINPSLSPKTDIGILFLETLEDGHINFVPQKEAVGPLPNHYGHIEFDCDKAADLQNLKAEPFYPLLRS